MSQFLTKQSQEIFFQLQLGKFCATLQESALCAALKRKTASFFEPYQYGWPASMELKELFMA